MSVITGEPEYEYKRKNFHIIGKHITLDDIRAIPKGHAAYISIIPRCTINGKTYHMLCDMFWQKDIYSGHVAADFGTGIKRHERPYSVLYDGISKRMPSWLDLMTFRIESDATEIYAIEYMHAKRNDIRYAISIIVDMSPFVGIMDELLVLTEEIPDIKAYEEIERSISSTKDISHGLMYYRDCITFKNK